MNRRSPGSPLPARLYLRPASVGRGCGTTAREEDIR